MKIIYYATTNQYLTCIYKLYLHGYEGRKKNPSKRCISKTGKIIMNNKIITIKNKLNQLSNKHN
jgi:hypothetical protein